MSRARRSVLTGFLLTTVIVATGCPPPPVSGTEQDPYWDDWQVEVETDFPYIVGTGADATVNIGVIAIGGLLAQDNFENRGDVIVKVDGEEDRIKVEMRRFTWRMNQEDADSDFLATELHAHTSSIRPPDETPPENKCGRRMEDDPDSFYPWQDGCSIRMYYRGQIQPARLGADIRVTLPSNYRHQIYITTNDNDEEEDYLNRGDVCVEDLNGKLDAELESGLAYVILHRETKPGPSCSAEAIQICEEWTENDEPAAWAGECGCSDFGRARVEAGGASNITIDAPRSLWANLSLDNQGANQTVADHCNATIDWPDAVLQDSDVEWKVNGEVNHPSDAAAQGAGFTLRAVSEDCSVVLHTDNPGDYVGKGNAAEQDSEMRGNLKLCSDCVAGKTCEELLAGA